MVHTFTAFCTSDELQMRIDGTDGHVMMMIPEGATVRIGDGAVLEVEAEGDKTCWIGDVEDVEGNMALINVR
jgi:hypothetical protein